MSFPLLRALTEHARSTHPTPRRRGSVLPESCAGSEHKGSSSQPLPRNGVHKPSRQIRRVEQNSLRILLKFIDLDQQHTGTVLLQ